MKTGAYPEMTEEEYRASDGANYSHMAAFYESQDHALLPVTPKSYFEFGNAFELYLQDIAQGTSKFYERFFVCDAPGSMPEKLPMMLKADQPLEDFYVYNKPDKKTGEVSRNKTNKKLHAWLDCCVENPGLMPMSESEFKVLQIMVTNMLKMDVEYTVGIDEKNREEKVFHNVGKIMESASFQVPIFWTANGIRKKALIDLMIATKSSTYTYDIKSSANAQGFLKMFRNKYWLQDIHYSEGCSKVFTNPNPMTFLTAFKEAPFIAQSFECNAQSRDQALLKYDVLCTEYAEWVANGMPPKGWKRLERVRLYL